METYSPYQELVVMLMGAIVPELWEKVLHYNSKNVFLKCIYNTEKNVCKINSIQEMFLNLYKELNVYTI